MVLVTIHQIVALLGLSLCLAVYSVLGKYGVPERIRIGASVFAILLTATFWSVVQLGADDDDD